MVRRVGLLFGAVVASAVLAAAPAAAMILLDGAVVNADSTVTYSYTVDNSLGDFAVAAWSLELALAAPDWDPKDVFAGGGVAVPDGWAADAGVPVSGQSAQDFLSIDPASDVAVGASLGGFSFTSAFLPGDVVFREFSALGDSVSGTTVGPSPLPEPQALAPFALLALLAVRLRRPGLRTMKSEACRVTLVAACWLALSGTERALPHIELGDAGDHTAPQL